MARQDPEIFQADTQGDSIILIEADKLFGHLKAPKKFTFFDSILHQDR